MRKFLHKHSQLGHGLGVMARLRGTEKPRETDPSLRSSSRLTHSKLCRDVFGLAAEEMANGSEVDVSHDRVHVVLCVDAEGEGPSRSRPFLRVLLHLLREHLPREDGHSCRDEGSGCNYLIFGVYSRLSTYTLAYILTVSICSTSDICSSIHRDRERDWKGREERSY